MNDAKGNCSIVLLHEAILALVKSSLYPVLVSIFFHFSCSKIVISKVGSTQKERFIHVFIQSFILYEFIEYLFNQFKTYFFNLNLEQDTMPGTEKDEVKIQDEKGTKSDLPHIPPLLPRPLFTVDLFWMWLDSPSHFSML